MQAQEISRPRVIADAKLAACVNRLGQTMVLDGVADVPFTIKIEVPPVAASQAPPKIITDPAIAACIGLLAQSLARSGAARVPLVIRASPARQQ